MTLIEELRARGMVHDITPDTEKLLESETVSAYIGFDPTAPSLHIGNLVQIMLLLHLQRNGHNVFALIGGATAMIGDPSGKSEERNMLSPEDVKFNTLKIQEQLTSLLRADGKPPVTIVNNLDWLGGLNLLEFLRDIGKKFSVSNMLSKDSVKNRLNSGISFTEFAYQIMQAYDFAFLNKTHSVSLQVGGSDQWGNMLGGIDLIKKNGVEANAFTCPLVTKSDGSKFGKSEQGNIWLDPALTSPYHFYQFWLNVSDEDAAKYIRIFTLLGLDEIAELEIAHTSKPDARMLQEALASYVTRMVHGSAQLSQAKLCSKVLFGDGAKEALEGLTQESLQAMFSGIRKFEVNISIVQYGVNIVELLAFNTSVFPSKNEARKMILGGGVSINKEKKLSTDEYIGRDNLILGKYMLVQRGKKNYFLIEAV